jgi:hypothetical protein
VSDFVVPDEGREITSAFGNHVTSNRATEKRHRVVTPVFDAKLIREVANAHNLRRKNHQTSALLNNYSATHLRCPRIMRRIGSVADRVAAVDAEHLVWACRDDEVPISSPSAVIDPAASMNIDPYICLDIGKREMNSPRRRNTSLLLDFCSNYRPVVTPPRNGSDQAPASPPRHFSLQSRR